jgi:hypothetical protein
MARRANCMPNASHAEDAGMLAYTSRTQLGSSVTSHTGQRSIIRFSDGCADARRVTATDSDADRFVKH